MLKHKKRHQLVKIDISTFTSLFQDIVTDC